MVGSTGGAAGCWPLAWAWVAAVRSSQAGAALGRLGRVGRIGRRLDGIGGGSGRRDLRIDRGEIHLLVAVDRRQLFQHVGVDLARQKRTDPSAMPASMPSAWPVPNPSGPLT